VALSSGTRRMIFLYPQLRTARNENLQGVLYGRPMPAVNTPNADALSFIAMRICILLVFCGLWVQLLGRDCEKLPLAVARERCKESQQRQQTFPMHPPPLVSFFGHEGGESFPIPRLFLDFRGREIRETAGDFLRRSESGHPHHHPFFFPTFFGGALRAHACQCTATWFWSGASFKA